MDLHRTASCFVLLLAVSCACLNAADSLPAVADPPDAGVEALPVPPVHALSSELRDAQLSFLRHPRVFPGCKVAPLDEIWDAEALEFENNAETAPADVDGLTPDAAQALDTFRGIVTSLGGTFELKSAYRPPAYQAHLHEVWVKWVKQLRGNRTRACQALREEVGAEFARHQLLVRQQPVPASDHELGLAFDAAIMLPRSARLKGKRVNVDKLAALAGITRPSKRRDPVHFKLIPERPRAISYASPSAF